jgi:uncharacterized delta-60 repeat protein
VRLPAATGRVGGAPGLLAKVSRDQSPTCSSQAVAGTTFDVTLARFGSDGAIDTAFGTQGVVTTAFGAGEDFARGISLQPGGRIVVVGQSSGATVSDFDIARYLADGTLDASFGDGGRLAVDFFGATDGEECVATQADGRLVVAGLATNGSSTGLGLVRQVP